jgi:serine/threonine-protein kinase RsbT
LVVEVTVVDALTDVLKDFVGTIVARSIVDGAASRSGIDPESATPAQVPALIDALDHAVKAFVPDPIAERECVCRLSTTLEERIGARGQAMSSTRMHVDIIEEYDIVSARNHARTLCDELGFSVSEQVKIATVVSELARNIVLYVGEGRIELELVMGARRGIEVRAIDEGPGIPNLATVIEGGYSSPTGLGVGLLGSRRLMDEFHIDSAPNQGTRITCRKYIG